MAWLATCVLPCLASKKSSEVESEWKKVNPQTTTARGKERGRERNRRKESKWWQVNHYYFISVSIQWSKHSFNPLFNMLFIQTTKYNLNLHSEIIIHQLIDSGCHVPFSLHSIWSTTAAVRPLSRAQSSFCHSRRSNLCPLPKLPVLLQYSVSYRFHFALLTNCQQFASISNRQKSLIKRTPFRATPSENPYSKAIV